MDFNRTPQPTAAPAHAPAPAAGSRKSRTEGKWGRIGVVAAVVVVVVLIVAAILVVAFGGKTKAESTFVDTGKLQAVFLQTGQVYFGNLKQVNNNYFVLDNIYYLQTSSSSTSTTSAANTSVSLVKLGCELHAPYDQMVINRTQVTFWENLQDSGQVATAVKNFEKQNPNGQKCSDQSSANNTGASNVQGSAGTSGTTTTGTASKSTTTP